MTEAGDVSCSAAPLTDKRQKFVEAYLGPARMNGTRAALMAGYSNKGAHTEGWRLLRIAAVRDAIAARLKEFSMSSAEATERMAEFARGSLEPFLTIDGQIDLATEEAQYNLHLLKKVKMTTRHSKDGDKLSETVEIEIHDPKDATDRILKLHGAYSQPEHEEVKFLILRDLKDVVPTDGK